MVLGSGLSGLAEHLEDRVRVPYAEIEGFPRSTVPGHAGNFVVGMLEGRVVGMAQGRFHLYEGYEPVEGDPRRLELATLVEDELLLSLPIIPQHGEGERCELPKDGGAAPGEGADTGLRRPFAGLKDLLEH